MARLYLFIVLVLVSVIAAASSRGDSVSPEQPLAKLAALSYQLGSEPRSDGWKPFDRNALRGRDDPYWLKLEFRFQNWQPPVAMRLTGLMAFEMHWDGQSIYSNGVPGQGSAEQPGLRQVEVYLPEGLTSDGPHELLLRASSVHWEDRGRWFEHRNRLIHRLEFHQAGRRGNGLDAEVALAIGFGGANFFVGVYFLALLFWRRDRVTYALCAVASAAVFCLGLLDVSPDIYNYPYSWHYPIWVCIAACVLALFALIPLIFLFHFRLDNKWLWASPLILVFVVSTVWAPGLTTGIWLILGSLVLTLVVCGYAAYRGAALAKWATCSILLFILGVAANPNLLYPGFSVLMMLILVTLIVKNQLEREALHRSTLMTARLEAELLRKNIQPHFLMNSLTNTMEWIETAPEQAAHFVELLAEEFRVFNRVAKHRLIPIKDELDLCRTHLEIMGYRLRKTFILDDNVVDMTRLVPPGVFHTLCENGISHNQYESDRVTFQLTVSVLDDVIRYRFTTPAVGEPVREANTGTGLSYIKSRLEQSFGRNWKLDASQVGSEWVTDIHVPSEN